MKLPALARDCAALDKRLVEAVRGIRVLDTVAWPAAVERRFLDELHQGRETLPRFNGKLFKQPDVIALDRDQIGLLLDAGKARGELHADLDPEAAATLFIGTVQGLVMQSMLADDVARIRSDAPGVFAIYLRGVGASS